MELQEFRSYYDDDSIHRYLAQKYSRYDTVEVGWIRWPDTTFPRGTMPIKLARHIFEACIPPMDLFMSLQKCPLCGASPLYYRVRQDQVEARPGFGFIVVDSGEGRLFVAPTLIAHFVLDHDYLPPDVFVQSVINGRVLESTVRRPWLECPTDEWHAE